MEYYKDGNGDSFPLYKRSEHYIKEISNYIKNKISNNKGSEDELLFFIMRETKCFISPGIILKIIREKN